MYFTLLNMRKRILTLTHSNATFTHSRMHKDSNKRLFGLKLQKIYDVSHIYHIIVNAHNIVSHSHIHNTEKNGKIRLKTSEFVYTHFQITPNTQVCLFTHTHINIVTQET